MSNSHLFISIYYLHIICIMHHVNHLVRLCVSIVHNLFAAGVGMHVCVVHVGKIYSAHGGLLIYLYIIKL